MPYHRVYARAAARKSGLKNGGGRMGHYADLVARERRFFAKHARQRKPARVGTIIIQNAMLVTKNSAEIKGKPKYRPMRNKNQEPIKLNKTYE